MTFIAPDNEAARLNALRDLNLLDTPPSEAFDRLTRMASRLLKAPVSTISLTDGDRQWFKSKVGVNLAEIPRHEAPCSYAIHSDEVFVVPDLLADDRFRDSPLAKAGIRFYAGAPLITRTGFGLGTICIVDEEPRLIKAEDERVLLDLAGMVMTQIEVQNMIGRLDAGSGEANEHQLFEDIDDLATSLPDDARVGILVECTSSAQVTDGLRVLGADFAETLTRSCIGRLRSVAGNSVRLYHVGPARCIAMWDESLTLSAEETIGMFRQALATPVVCAGVPVILDPAIGLCRFRTGSTTGRALVRFLNGAVDDARRASLPYAAYDEVQDRMHARRFGILNDVARALESGDAFSLVYQPRVDLRTGRCAGAEVLLRWNHAELGPIPPAEFFPLIEQTAYVKPVTDWVVRTALMQLSAWRRDGVRVPRLSINVSARNLCEGDLADRLAGYIEANGLIPSDIELECTESALVSESIAISSRFALLRNKGLQISIDDFGTGFSSLSYLRTMPASIVKIDRSFVCDLRANGRDGVLVRNLIGLCHELGYGVVAEGIESEDARNLLRDWGCDEGQGYWFARPMSARALIGWLRDFDLSCVDMADAE